MNECDECGVLTDKRLYITFNLLFHLNNILKPHFKEIEKLVCKDCHMKYCDGFKKLARTVSELQVKVQRAMYEDKGDIKKLR